MTFKTDSAGRYVIKRIVAGGPAEACGGVQAGDILMAIGGAPTASMDKKEMARAVMGVPGSSVVVELQSAGGGPSRHVQLTRGEAKDSATATTSPQAASHAYAPSPAAPAPAPAPAPSGGGGKAGLGMTFISKNGVYLIKRLVGGGPADMSEGLVRAGDEVVSINGKLTGALSQKELAREVVGPDGSAVVLGLRRNGESLTVTLHRAFSQTVRNEDSIMSQGSVQSFPDVTPVAPAPAPAPQPSPPQPAAAPAASSSRGSSGKAGLGMTFKTDSAGRYVIKRIVAGGPAEACGGVQAGDILMAIGGAPTASMDKKEMARAVMGVPGSSVVVELQSAGGGPSRHVQITRALGSSSRDSDTGSVMSADSDATSIDFDMQGHQPVQSEGSGDSNASFTPAPKAVRGKVGLGMTFSASSSGQFVVKRVLEDGPAAQTGRIMAGDIILSVGGMSVAGASQRDLARLVLGPRGTTTEVVVQRGDDMDVVSIQRQSD